MLTLNTIRKQPGATSTRKRLGRGAGSGLGPRAGKGDKGQKARKSGGVRIGFEGGQTPLYRRVPKFGFKNFARRPTAEVNLSTLEKKFQGDTVSLETLRAEGLIKRKADRLAVLGVGELKKGLTVKAHRVSASAKEKIEKAGGKVEILPIPGQAEHTLKFQNSVKGSCSPSRCWRSTVSVSTFRHQVCTQETSLPCSNSFKAPFLVSSTCLPVARLSDSPSSLLA
jgi:large subunit ribosomal protein L15